MITAEAQLEIHVRAQRTGPGYSTCRECRHTFFPKNEDQHCLELCNSCMEDLRGLREPVISVRVKARGPRLTQ